MTGDVQRTSENTLGSWQTECAEHVRVIIRTNFTDATVASKAVRRPAHPTVMSNRNEHSTSF